ncbi:MAG TPA: class I SAM-dependent methyltransferase [Thermoanaerobaculia bacterium]|nr:class I SAM-dependent methyltransferase [Thermoanaerobaculia bacterium]
MSAARLLRNRRVPTRRSPGDPIRESFFGALMRKYYEAPEVAEIYAGHAGLHPAEEALLAELRAELSRASLLDIGIGPGRTTPHLRAACRRYTGIDYSANMLRHAHARYPDAALVLCDARALCFAGGAFDAVFFCFNAIGDVGHEDRLRILREIRRTLRPGGVFVFSAHNRDARLPGAFAPPPLRGADGAGGIGAAAWLSTHGERLRRYGRGIRNHLRLRRHQRKTAEYRIATDYSYEHNLLSYYISGEAQVRQLEALGYSAVRTLDKEGSALPRGARSRGSYIYYVARRPAATTTL